MERIDELEPSSFLSSPSGKSWAVFSPSPRTGDGPVFHYAAPQYRYLLGRSTGLAGSHRVGFVGLNPSTADAEKDDPTIRKCLGFARRWGFSEIIVANVYAFRATDPKQLQHAQDPVGPLNERALTSLVKRCEYIVCAWGKHARARGEYTSKLLANAGAELRCLALNKDGSPKHPLYIPYGDGPPPRFTTICGKGHAMLGSCGRPVGHGGSCMFV